MHTIIIRSTLNWRKTEYSQLWNQEIKSAVQLWDKTFKLSYFECRARIKEIAQKQFELMPCFVYEYQQEDLIDINDDDWLLICDDDDWYHPDIFSILEKLKESDIALWQDGVYGYHVPYVPAERKTENYLPQLENWVTTAKLRTLEDKNVFAKVKTNNYALIGHLLKNYPLTAFLGHGKTDKMINHYQLNTIEINQPLSLVNRNPCSYTILTNLMKHSPSAKELRQFVGHYAVSELNMNSIKPFEWAIPLIVETKQIFLNCLTD